MKIIEHKPQGVFERVLSDAEVDSLAASGNTEAKKEVYKRTWAIMTAAQKIDAIKDVIGI